MMFLWIWLVVFPVAGLALRRDVQAMWPYVSVLVVSFVVHVVAVMGLPGIVLLAAVLAIVFLGLLVALSFPEDVAQRAARAIKATVLNIRNAVSGTRAKGGAANLP